MNIFTKTIKAGADLIKASDKLIDETVTNQQERGKLKNGFTQLFTQVDQFIETQVTERLKIDNVGSWLTKNIRPLSLLIIVLSYVFNKHLGLDASTVTGLYEWGKVSIQFYFGVRTLEKAIPLVSDFTKSLRRKQ